jgi:hypothetical protein
LAAIRPIRKVGESGDLQAMEDDPLLKLERLREAKLAQLAAEKVPEKQTTVLTSKKFVLRCYCPV